MAMLCPTFSAPAGGLNTTRRGAQGTLSSANLAWLYVLGAGALEIVWASGLKYDVVPAALVIVSLLVTFELLVRSARVLPVGTMYAVFTGIGTIGTIIVDSIMSGSMVPFGKIVLILLLLLCVVGLKITSDEVSS